MQPELEIDDDLESSSYYSGTFRWKRSKVLPIMPNAVPSKLRQRGVEWRKGWKEYFTTRGLVSELPSNVTSANMSQWMMQYAFNDLSLVDCLSFPLSIAYYLHTFGASLGLSSDRQYDKITIICIGCAEKAEERILRQTNAFLELQCALPHIRHIEVWLVGPEISSTIQNYQSKSISLDKTPLSESTISFSLFKGTSSQFFRSYPQCLSGEAIVVGFNCGFGNFENPLPRRYDLFLSWLSDLVFLTATQLPLVFFCANDYADLVGETSIMLHILGAQFITLPVENPFSFASTMIPPSSGAKKESEEYARGNSFYYAVQGSDRKRKNKDIIQHRADIDKNKDFLIRKLVDILSPSTIARCLQEVGRFKITGKLNLKDRLPTNEMESTIANTNQKEFSTDSSPIGSQNNADMPNAQLNSDVMIKQDSTEGNAIPPSLEKEEPDGEETIPFTIKQSIVNDRILLSEVQLSASYTSSSRYELKHVEVDVHSSGENMKLCLQGKGEQLLQVVCLIHKVQVKSGSMTAKYSKKAKTLKIELPLAL